MKLEEFLQIFNAEPKDDYIKSIIDYVNKQRIVLDNRIKQYILNIEANKKLPDEQKEREEFLLANISGQDEMNIQIIQWNFSIACFSVLKENHINPFIYIIPSDFLQQNQIERLQDYGNALDKYLFVHWPFFRQFFQKKREFQFEFKKLIDLMFKCVDKDQLYKLTIDSKDLLENYATYNTLLKNKIEYSKTKLEYDISLIAEYLTQIFQDQKQIMIIHAVMSKIVDQLSEFPALIQELTQQSILRLICFLDLQSFDISYNPPAQVQLLEKYKLIQNPSEELQAVIKELEENKERQLMVGISVPQAILSQTYDPMKNNQFKKQDKDIIQKKTKQYTNLIQQLPAWQLLQEIKDLRYFDYKCSREQLDQAITYMEIHSRDEKEQKEKLEKESIQEQTQK